MTLFFVPSYLKTNLCDDTITFFCILYVMQRMCLHYVTARRKKSSFLMWNCISAMRRRVNTPPQGAHNNNNSNSNIRKSCDYQLIQATTPRQVELFCSYMDCTQVYALAPLQCTWALCVRNQSTCDHSTL